MGLISRVSSRTYRNRDMSREMFLTKASKFTCRIFSKRFQSRFRRLSPASELISVNKQSKNPIESDLSNINDIAQISNETQMVSKNVDIDNILRRFDQPPTEIIGLLLASGNVPPKRAAYILSKIPDLHLPLENYARYKKTDPRTRIGLKKLEYLTES